MADSKAFGKEGIVIQVPAVISQRTESHVKPGRLTVLVSGLEIYNSDSLLMHRFEREDVDDIKVHTPYEISIRQRFIGKPDISYRLISAKMPEVIPILEVQFSKKIELLEVAMMPRSTRTSSLAEKGYSVWHAGEWLSKPSVHKTCKVTAKLSTPMVHIDHDVSHTATAGFSSLATAHLLVNKNIFRPFFLVFTLWILDHSVLSFPLELWFPSRSERFWWHFQKKESSQVRCFHFFPPFGLRTNTLGSYLASSPPALVCLHPDPTSLSVFLALSWGLPSPPSRCAFGCQNFW